MSALAAAVIGIALNFFFNTTNYFSNRRTRRNALKLAIFTSNVRTPIMEALRGLDAIMDGADDIVRGPPPFTEKIKATNELSKKFHGARRVLARLLNDCDKSLIIDGNDWSRCDEGHMDNATDAFVDACNATDGVALRDNLHRAAMAINSLRDQLQSKMDAEARRLMK